MDQNLRMLPTFIVVLLAHSIASKVTQLATPKGLDSLDRAKTYVNATDRAFISPIIVSNRSRPDAQSLTMATSKLLTILFHRSHIAPHTHRTPKISEFGSDILRWSHKISLFLQVIPCTASLASLFPQLCPLSVSASS